VVVAERIEPMPTDGPLTVTADKTFGDVADPAETAPVVGSVCTGALILAAALLEGRNATTHWPTRRWCGTQAVRPGTAPAGA
jgi:transcriptional regulator GlxA family with amidase domain